MSGLSVSVVIPAYKAARTINRAVESALGQTRKPDEVLVVDDGSPDGADVSAALARYGGRVALLRKANGGAASARNHGLERARGNVIGFLDADDYWEPDKLERQLGLLDRHPEVGLTAGQWYTEQPGDPREAPPPPPAPDADVYDRVWRPQGPDAFRVACCVLTSTVLVRRDVLGEHRFVPGLEPAEDRDMWCRLVAGAAVYLWSEPLITYVLEPGSLCRTHIDRNYRNMLRVIHRHAGVLGRHLRRWEASTYQRWAGTLLSDGQPAAALRPAVERLRRRVFSVQGWYVLGKCLARCCRQWAARPAVTQPAPTPALGPA
jgi:glycosyltransferase involved in cell wall biosynthesis